MILKRRSKFRFSIYNNLRVSILIFVAILVVGAGFDTPYVGREQRSGYNDPCGICGFNQTLFNPLASRVAVVINETRHKYAGIPGSGYDYDRRNEYKLDPSEHKFIGCTEGKTSSDGTCDLRYGFKVISWNKLE